MRKTVSHTRTHSQDAKEDNSDSYEARKRREGVATSQTDGNTPSLVEKEEEREREREVGEKEEQQAGSHHRPIARDNKELRASATLRT